MLRKYFRQLQREFGSDFDSLFHFDSTTINDYSQDGTTIQGRPDAVFLPRSTTHIKSLLSFLNKSGITTPIIPFGAGTGQSGGAVALDGGIVISFIHMNRILAIDPLERVACVEPGVITERIHHEVEQIGLYYPPDPASLDKCTIGGNIAENAGGPRCFKYGTTKDYVLGLEVVLADGEVIQTSPPLLKNVAGFDLTKLLCGSEGTLGVITKAWLKLIPKPLYRYTILLEYPDESNSISGISGLMSSSLVPSALEWLDEKSIYLIREDNSQLFSTTESRSILICEIDSCSREDIEWQLAQVKLNAQAKNIRVERESAGCSEIWRIRRALSEKLKTLGLIKWNEDVVIPRKHLLAYIHYARNIAEKYDLLVVLFGHVGDGNIHTNLLTKPEQNSKELKRTILGDFFSGIKKFGGSISGEHGIGIAKSDFLEDAIGKRQLQLLRGIKKVFDPENRINPGKMCLNSKKPEN